MSGETNYDTHQWFFDGEVVECVRCCVRSYDGTYAHMSCGENYPDLTET
jgi:hypothetical protein